MHHHTHKQYDKHNPIAVYLKNLYITAQEKKHYHRGVHLTITVQ